MQIFLTTLFQMNLNELDSEFYCEMYILLIIGHCRVFQRSVFLGFFFTSWTFYQFCHLFTCINLVLHGFSHIISWNNMKNVWVCMSTVYIKQKKKYRPLFSHIDWQIVFSSVKKVPLQYIWSLHNYNEKVAIVININERCPWLMLDQHLKCVSKRSNSLKTAGEQQSRQRLLITMISII